ncbi:MAG: ABC transporter permease [Clostridia bacterium]|nr:ABC transporter permease [Clostridia bacterium]
MKKFFRLTKERFKKFFKYWDLLMLLVQRDLKLKYRRSFLGYLWSVLNPLLSMIVMAIVFTRMFKRNIENFPLYLICGNILFSFMRDSTTQAMTSVISNASLLKKTYVPKYIFTLSKVTSCMVNFVLSLGALFIVMIATKQPFRWMNFMIIVPIVELYVFCLGLGLLLAAGTVFFRDIRNIWNVVTLAWMYLTPIFYSLDSFNDSKTKDIVDMSKLGLFIRRFNPLYMYIQQFRYFIMQYESTLVEVPCGVLMWRGAVCAGLMLIVGLITFNATKNKFILYI